MTSTEKTLEFADGRTIAYEEIGNLTSTTIVIFLHGAFSVGSATRTYPVFEQKDVHLIAPTIPGWGNSSSIPSTFPTFAAGFASDITALINHTTPADDPNLKLYIAGGSYGTVHAQMLYGASYDVFPLGKQIKGLLILAPFSSPRCHKEYAKALPWSSYISVGPPSQYIPFNLISRLTKFIMQRKIDSVDSAEKFIRSFLFDKMNADEKEMYRKWREDKGMAEGQLEREMAENNIRSVAKTWQGVMDIAAVLHSDWGFCPSTLDEEHSRHPVLIYASAEDDTLPGAIAEWLGDNYRNARLERIEGGHIAGLFRMDAIWAEFLKDL